jgi:hypothetical protein
MEVFVFAGQTWLCAWKRAVGRHPLHAFVWHKGPGPHWGMGSEVWEKAEKTKRTSPMVQHGAFDLMLFNAFYIFYIIIIFFSTSQEWVGFDLILIWFWSLLQQANGYPQSKWLAEMMVFEAKLLGESWAIEPKIIERVMTHFSDPCLKQVNFLKVHS